MAITIRQLLRRASREVCEVVRADTAVTPGQEGRHAVTFYFEPARGDLHGQALVYFSDWRVLVDLLLLPRMRKGGRFACVHRVNFQGAAADRKAFLYSPQRRRLAAKGVQTVCPLSREEEEALSA